MYIKFGLCVAPQCAKYPEGHLEAQEAKEQEKSGKRKTIEEMLQQQGPSETKKAKKAAGYQLEPATSKLIDQDKLNVKLWQQCNEALGDTKQVAIFNAWNFA